LAAGSTRKRPLPTTTDALDSREYGVELGRLHSCERYFERAAEAAEAITPTTAALLQHTRTIPIIFANIADPVGSGFVASFPRPGGNATGFVLFEPTMAGKWLELLKEIAPRVNRVAFLFNPATATYFEYYTNPFKAAAASFGVEAIAAPVHDRSELESAFAAQAREPNGSLIVLPDSFLNAHSVEITSLAARYVSLPSIRTVCTLKSVASCPMEMTCSIIIGGRPATSTASSRARSPRTCQ
jgi:ABC transporter substrate binding protein